MTSPYTVSAWDKTKRDYPIIPAWTHEARLYWLVDIGTQPNNFPWAKSPTKKEIILMFEFPTQTTVFHEEKWPQPFVLSRRFGKSFHEKANLRVFLEAMLGRKFTPEETTGFPLDTLLWKTLFCSVAHIQKWEKTYANILSWMPLPKSIECPAQVNDTLLYSVSAHDEDTFNKLGKYTQDLIQGSTEWKQRLEDWSRWTEEPKGVTLEEAKAAFGE